MNTIYEYWIEEGGTPMPAGANILHVGYQSIGPDSYDLFAWAQVDTAAPTVIRQLVIVGTGWDNRDGKPGKHLGTVQMPSGLVWHVFDHGEH